MSKFVIAFAVTLWATSASAAALVQYAPPPGWVKAVSVPAPSPSSDGAAIQLLLQEQQTLYGPDGDQVFTESVFQIQSPQGLAVVPAIAPTWNPETQTLVLHRFNVVRGKQTIDLLAGGTKVIVLRRETNLELATLDGSLTATIQPEGLKVGDVIDFAATLSRRDPVYQGRSEGAFALASQNPVGRLLVRQLWPASKPIRWKVTDGMPAPTVSETASGTELVVDLENVATPKPPSGAPARFQNLGQLELSQFASWPEVSALMAPLYAKATALSANSPLKLEARRISEASADPRIRAAAALRLVQDQVRYAFIGMNLGGYTPAEADVTWSRRFGDCKGKSALLVALLRELGIQAEPALISVELGDGLEGRLPMLGVFDHVIVRAQIGGKVYWLDGTRTGDRNLDDVAVPDFHWALPVRSAGAQLEKLEPRKLDQPAFESLLRLDATAGIDSPAPAHAEHILRGDGAVTENLALSGASRTDAERTLRAYWRDLYSWVDVKSVAFSFDDARRTMRLEMDGVATMDWNDSDGFRDFDITGSNLGFDSSFKREPGLHSDAPFFVPFPFYKTWTTIIALPQKAAGFSLVNAQAVDRTVAARHFERHSRIDDGVVTVVASETTTAPDFPAAGAEAAGRILRQMDQYDVVVRAPAMSQAPVKATDDSPLPTPVTAADFSRRGESYLLNHDLDHAIADLDQAVRLDPKASRNFYNRGAAHFERGDDVLALADFDHAINLNPKDVLALEGRAELQLFQGQDAQARRDFEEAARLSPSDHEIPLRHARIYESAGRYQGAIRIYDELIASSSNASNFNLRCRARAKWGRELPAALADCDAALKLEPANALALDSRGLVLLRMDKFDDAIRDYEAALQLNPTQAASLYGRGVAQSRRGPKGKGAADISAARALRPQVDAEFARFGVKP